MKTIRLVWLAVLTVFLVLAIGYVGYLTGADDGRIFGTDCRTSYCQ